MDGGGAMDGGTDIINHQWTIIEENEKKEENNEERPNSHYKNDTYGIKNIK